MSPVATASPSSMASAVVTPAPPANLSAAAKIVWSITYVKALAQAKLDHPDNPRAQSMVALKAANALLAVPPPTSAAEIDALEPWQVLQRGTRIINGALTAVCVTTDGRKYSFPVVDAPPAVPVNLAAMTKAEIVAHAQDVHGLELDPNLKKEELIAAVAAKAA